jgi:hypothetical protein
MPAALEAAIARDTEHQVDDAAGGDGGADQGRALAGEVLGDAARGVAVDGPTGVVTRVVIGRLDVEEVTGTDAGHAASSVGWPYLKASWS